MAKSSRDTRPVAAGSQTLLTLAERRILDSSVGRSLSEATHKQLQATLAKARTLRDKWQDLFKRQTMATKRTARHGERANTRSLDKSELFAAAVKRIEARIAEAAEAVNKAVASMERAATGGTPPQPASKAVKKAAPQAAKKKPAARVTAAKRTAAASGSGSATAKPAVSKKARQAGARKAVSAASSGQALGYDPKKQRSAKASATRTQIKLDGLSTRRRGHDIVSGKRKQARRDGR